MAFDLVAAGGYGNGELGDKTGANFGEYDYSMNYCATVTSISSNQTNPSTLDLDYVGSASLGAAEDVHFGKVGTEILIVAVAKSDTAAAKNFIGKWAVATITATSDTLAGASTYTVVVNKNLFHLREALSNNCKLLVVTVPHFKNLTLNSGEVLVPNECSEGFPIAFKCSGTLTFNGGHIDLTGMGTNVRPLLNQEENGNVDTDKYAGWENSATKDRFVINNGDGAAFIIAQNIVVADDTSRIGNPATYGAQYCRGAVMSYDKPSKVTIHGGSTILICAGTFTGFTPKLIAKYRSTSGGSGLARCYIASGTRLTNDEGLYAYDNISNPAVVTDTLKVKSFGDGSNGSSTTSVLWSNFAAVTAFSKNRKVLTVKSMTTDGAVAFAPGALVMIHTKNKDSTNTKNAGRFYLAKIIGVNGNDITLDTAAPYNTFNAWLDTYYVQILTIPQFTNFKPSKNVGTQIPAWSDANGYGGIFAVACNNTCNLSGRAVNVEGKGGGAAYGRNGLMHIGNAQDNDRLPIGQGHGSVFILAKNLAMNSATRIGATYSGAVSRRGYYGGEGGSPTGGAGTYGGGYQGAYQSVVSTGSNGAPGQGAKGGDNEKKDGISGGYGSNGYLDAKTVNTAPQGAHIMIIADTITGFNQAAISTGGGGATKITGRISTPNRPPGYGGSAGYGGGGAATHEASGQAYGGEGGYNGGGSGGKCGTCNDTWGSGGGAAGWAFIYCNNAVNQDTTDTVVD